MPAQERIYHPPDAVHFLICARVIDGDDITHFAGKAKTLNAKYEFHLLNFSSGIKVTF